jgi:hypothetical protein
MLVYSNPIVFGSLIDIKGVCNFIFSVDVPQQRSGCYILGIGAGRKKNQSRCGRVHNYHVQIGSWNSLRYPKLLAESNEYTEAKEKSEVSLNFATAFPVVDSFSG